MAYVYTIEFQKQRLPHMHFLILFVVENKTIDVVAIDHIVCVEFLNPKIDLIFFSI